jgi:radical SAM superfamily enzyme YgiQ (UPF0313 family)
VHVLVVSTYELGHQPLHAAAPAGALRARGHDVRVLDLSVDSWDPAVLDGIDKVIISVPMHTAARLARTLLPRIDRPSCCFGLYASTCADLADAVVAGEYDDAVVAWVETGDAGAPVQLGRRSMPSTVPAPARDAFPALERYAHLALGDEERPVGYVEASHGCAHRCRHCPVPVVYDGRIRIVSEDDVVRDVDQLVEMGARHITFGDPDFFNGVHHSRRVVRSVHRRYPELTFDCTVKVEHILRHESVWSEMAAMGCLFVVSAFESTDDSTLARLDKGHTVADAARVVALLRDHGIEIRPSFLPFMPWTTVAHVRDLAVFVAEHDLVGNVDPVQYTIRLLLPPGSLLLDDPDVAASIESYDADALSYVWSASDPTVDELQRELAALVERSVAAGESIPTTYGRVRETLGLSSLIEVGSTEGRPRLTEPWFC